MNSSPDQQALIADYAAGVIDADDFRKLERTLRSDAEFRRDFMEYMNLDSAISDRAALSDAEFDAMNCDPSASNETVAPTRRPNRRPTWRYFGVIVGIAAVMLLIAGTAWFLPTTESDIPMASVTAEVTSLDAARLADFDQDVRVGDRIHLNRIRLEAGTMQVRLDSGVVLDLFAPLDGTLQSSMRLQLARGRLNADVGESGQGFMILTDHGQIIDLGTRFGVDVSDDEASVAVFDGEVKVESGGSANTARSLRVYEGEGVRLGKGRRPRRLSAVWLSQGRFGFSASNASSIVSDITDNAVTDGFHRFYGIIAGGMREGTIAYTTHASTPRPDIVWRAAEGEEFPSELLGADVVCPFHIDRQEQSLTISLQLAGPADVYVMHDLRRNPSVWLKNGFQETSLTLRSGPWRPVSPLAQGIKPNREGDIYVQYSVWKKRVDAAGQVELGPPQTDGDQGNKAMYGIAVKAISDG
ncbi:FecR protein [Rubripirellula lacrimiformis]|uniref:FecR protein n=1 Tax=Rubripirellula lacrimiformis TaxID=1930273 RepID=A0A517NJU0_9BACT|nr:FecR family protein [Rubripirellula lacrimiformis]QDT07390.1 FecR protein [Rubripirellula lacrimiformis]